MRQSYCCCCCVLPNDWAGIRLEYHITISRSWQWSYIIRSLVSFARRRHVTKNCFASATEHRCLTVTAYRLMLVSKSLCWKWRTVNFNAALPASRQREATRRDARDTSHSFSRHGLTSCFKTSTVFQRRRSAVQASCKDRANFTATLFVGPTSEASARDKSDHKGWHWCFFLTER